MESQSYFKRMKKEANNENNTIKNLKRTFYQSNSYNTQLTECKISLLKSIFKVSA